MPLYKLKAMDITDHTDTKPRWIVNNTDMYVNDQPDTESQTMDSQPSPSCLSEQFRGESGESLDVFEDEESVESRTTNAGQLTVSSTENESKSRRLSDEERQAKKLKGENCVVPGETIEELVHHWSVAAPDSEAFVAVTPSVAGVTATEASQRRSLTCYEVDVLVRKFAAYLRHQGISKGDVVCVAVANSLERVVADFGTICSGAVALNGQVFRSDGEDLIQALNSTKARAIVLDPDSPHGAWRILRNHIGSLDSEVHSERLPHLRRVIACQRSDDPTVDFLNKLRNFRLSLQRAHALKSDVALIWTTSGSTGYSKLVPQTHGNIMHIALQVLHIAKLQLGEKFLNCAPLGWAGGFPLWFLASGATRVFVDTFRGPPANMATALWECVQREKVVYVFASPMYVAAILDKKELWQEETVADSTQEKTLCDTTQGQPLSDSSQGRSLSASAQRESLSTSYQGMSLSGSAQGTPLSVSNQGASFCKHGALPSASKEAEGRAPCLQCMGRKIWRPRGICLAGQPMKRTVVAAAGKICDFIDINYGTTECGVLATVHITDPALYQDGLTGPPAVGVEVRIVDENLQDVAQGQTGEVLARSPALYGRYIENDEATAHTFTPDGWFRTDDVAYQLPDGQLVHLGRRSDAITRGAYLCYPGWLEAILRRAPGVKDVCVVPVSDPVLHHEICACVVPSQQPPPSEFEESLRTVADSQLLTLPGDAQHMTPKYYVILDSLPLTPTGKISRREACAVAEQRLGL